MKRASLSLLLTLSLLTGIASAAPVKYSDLLKEEAFANGTAEQRLDIVNQKIVSKAIQSYDINADVMGCMVLEYLQPEQEPAARMNQYGVVAKHMAATPLEQRKATFQEYSPLLDFFTKSSIQHGFEQ